MNHLIDIVLVSDAKNPILKRLTEMAILSAGSYANVIVVESNHAVSYEKALTVHPREPFCYNRYLNIGAKHGNSDYIFFGNNDIVFFPGWDEIIISKMKEHSVISASPASPLPFGLVPTIGGECFFGYEIGKAFCGWAFVWERAFFDKVGGLDEGFIFWCSDNVTVEQLIACDEKHLMVTSSLVLHLGSSTLKSLDKALLHAYTIEEVEKFNKRFNKNLWEAPHMRGRKSN